MLSKLGGLWDECGARPHLPLRYFAGQHTFTVGADSAAVPEARFGLPEVKWAIYPFGGRVPHRYGRESRRTARDCLRPKLSSSGWRRGVLPRALWPSASLAPR